MIILFILITLPVIATAAFFLLVGDMFSNNGSCDDEWANTLKTYKGLQF